MKTLGQSASDAYVHWSLFLSSYVPLLAIFALRISESHPARAFWIAVAAGALTANLSLLLNRRTAPRDFKVADIRGAGSDVAAYVATYLLPFLVVSDIGWRDLTAYALLVLTIGIVMIRDGLLHVNPLLAVFRWHIFTITTADGSNYYLISTRRPKSGNVVRAVTLRPRLLMEK